MPLFEQQWRLAYAGVEYLWGGIDPADPFKRWLGRGSNAEAPEWSDTELELETWGRPRQDGVGFGQDFRRGKTVTFQLIFKGAGSTNAATRAHASQLIADAERAWLAEDEAGERLAPGQLATLTTRYGGVERTIYGRPRKFTPIYATLASGQARAVATFDCASDTWFGDEESLRVDMVPPTSTGGVALPVALPHPIASGEVVAGAVVNAGTRPSWLAVDVHGPITNPVVTLVGRWQLRLSGTIAAGRHVTVDPRPGFRSIVNDQGASWANAYSRSYASPSDMRMPVGASELTLGGVDVTGSSYVIARWAPAYASMV